MYLVVEWMTTSAPSDSGFCRYGVAKVLSSTRTAPAVCAMSANPAMSKMFSSGFVGVSAMIIRVVGRIAARTASRSPSGSAVCSMPHGPRMALTSRYVPPYASVGRMTWSPGRSAARIRVSSEAIPELKANP